MLSWLIIYYKAGNFYNKKGVSKYPLSIIPNNQSNLNYICKIDKKCKLLKYKITLMTSNLTMLNSYVTMKNAKL